MILATKLEVGDIIQPDWLPEGETFTVTSVAVEGLIVYRHPHGQFCIRTTSWTNIPFTVVGRTDHIRRGGKRFNEAWEAFKAFQGFPLCPVCDSHLQVYRYEGGGFICIMCSTRIKA